jgi:hypothetical protein
LRRTGVSLTLTNIGGFGPVLSLFCTFHVPLLSPFLELQRDRRNELRSQALHRGHFDFQPAL